MTKRRDQDRERWLQAVGQAIRAYRTELGISQEELGARAGLHRTYVSDVERGQRNPTAWTLLQISGPLGKKPSEILGAAEGILAESE